MSSRRLRRDENVSFVVSKEKEREGKQRKQEGHIDSTYLCADQFIESGMRKRLQICCCCSVVLYSIGVGSSAKDCTTSIIFVAPLPLLG